MIVADLKRKENISKKAVMLNIRKDELDKLSTSLPVKDMSILWNMLTYLMRQDKSIEISVTQDISKANTVREERKERKKKVNERLKRIHFSDEKRSLYFVQKQKEYDVEVLEKLLELEEWYVCIQEYDGRTPNEHDYLKKFNEIQDELQKLNSRINPTLFFKDGPDDVALCGGILIINETKWSSSDEQKAVCLMSAVQWLVRQQAKDYEQQKLITTPTETEFPKPVNSFEEAFKTLLTKYLELNTQGTNTNINGKSWNKNRLIVATMYVLQSRGTLPTIDETMYAELVAPIIGWDSENLRKNINHHQQDIKPYGCNLKCLDEDYISKNIPDDGKGMSRKNFKNRWKGMFELVDSLIANNEDLASLRGNSAETPRVICAEIKRTKADSA